MDMQRVTSLVMIPETELQSLKTTQLEILQHLKTLQAGNRKNAEADHVTAIEFMAAVRICRSKFDQLVNTGKLKSIKKMRKIYVPVSEIERYFKDPAIQ